MCVHSVTFFYYVSSQFISHPHLEKIADCNFESQRVTRTSYFLLSWTGKHSRITHVVDTHTVPDRSLCSGISSTYFLFNLIGSRVQFRFVPWDQKVFQEAWLQLHPCVDYILFSLLEKAGVEEFNSGRFHSTGAVYLLPTRLTASHGFPIKS
jgi:hypothetical protein